MPIASFKESHLEQLGRALADAATHRELSALFDQCGISEQDGGPKWERILRALSARQLSDRCGNNVGAFIQVILDPARFPGRPDEHRELCISVNRVLAFSGLRVKDNGRLVTVDAASTVSEAEECASRLRSTLLP